MLPWRRIPPASAVGLAESGLQVGTVCRHRNWQPGLPTHYPVRFDTERLDLDALLVPDILPTFSVTSFQAKGNGENNVNKGLSGLG